MHPFEPIDQLFLFPKNEGPSLFEGVRSEQIVNVASIPQRSPFRYPGGKTWLVPTIRKWVRSLPERPYEFIEPFAGGGIIGLTVAFEDLANKVRMVELDDDVAAVWKVILEGDAEWLAEKILAFNLNPDTVHEELNKPVRSLRQKAFRTLLRNRINHGGILAPGSGLIKHGENGKGLLSRWYPQTLAGRVRAIATIRDRIRFTEGDGMNALQENAHRREVISFIDPPYTAAGKKAGRRLYKHNFIDHDELFRIAKGLVGDFLMTYDNAEGVVQLAEKHGLDIQPIAMKSTHHTEMTELLIGRDLTWAR